MKKRRRKTPPDPQPRPIVTRTIIDLEFMRPPDPTPMLKARRRPRRRGPLA